MNNEYFYKKIASLMPIEPEKPRRAAVLLLLREGEEGPELVFEVRSDKLKRQGGEICLPGGGVEPGETAEQCALRETAEELGVHNVTLLAHADTLRHSTGERLEVFAGRMEAVPFLPNEEVGEVFTVPLAWLRSHPPERARYVLRPDFEASSPQLHQFLERYGRESVSPMWVYEGHVIWGLTARIVEQFLLRTAQ